MDNQKEDWYSEQAVISPLTPQAGSIKKILMMMMLMK